MSDGSLSAGHTLAGRYRVVEAIGSGGMARVYLADDEALGRRVAVKVLRSDIPDGATADRAAVETRLLASLNHPGLVTLFDAHLGHEPRFLVMEHVVGTTLAARIADGPLEIRELSALGSQLADALHVVHDAGIVHRDVKPSNILLARSTAPGVPLRAKLADFGIAHLLDGERMTSPSLLVGTAAYIAPELLHGADPAPPSDIYALGLVLLEAASGTRAFAGAEGNRGQLLARLSRDPEMPAELDHRWRDLMCAMTAREPADRPTAHEVMARITAGNGDVVGEGPGAALVEQQRRAALAGVATAAWPVTDLVAAPAPSVSATAPVSASAAVSAAPADTTPTVVASTVTATAASVPERVQTDRRRRRGRRRLALATGAVSAAGIAGLVAASVLLWQPDATPTTEPAESPAVQTPNVTPATETVVTDTSADLEQPADDSADGDVPATGSTVAPAVDQTGTGGAVDGGPPPENGVGNSPGSNNGNGTDNGSGNGSNSGNGPGSNSGNGPGSNSGNGPGSNSGSGPGSNSGNGGGRSSGKPAPGDG
ncbi:serine/threonine-protein kinase [Microbacterium oleivorans]|uniref:non-specific serine/threonine protein kinase n=1 Tax=Microbacterium oleivorans TaxID=273677 RepID=A0A7D5IPP4_9MICO|nr:serine/threonine-protein kinase [Microbacterium oleivorans]QLD11001.1 serine/threonine protein kinase [Microbacterium oleivorans]